MRNQYCSHFHIDCGECVCWAVADRMGKHTLRIEDIQKLVRPCGCGGNEKLCEFRKVGGLK